MRRLQQPTVLLKQFAKTPNADISLQKLRHRAAGKVLNVMKEKSCGKEKAKLQIVNVIRYRKAEKVGQTESCCAIVIASLTRTVVMNREDVQS